MTVFLAYDGNFGVNYGERVEEEKKQQQEKCASKGIRVTPKQTINLCQSLVQSHLEYGISLWYAAMPQKAKNKLQILQNKIIRFMLDRPRTHITEEHMKRTKHA